MLDNKYIIINMRYEIKIGEGGWIKRSYTDYAGLKISVNSRIASPFSRQIANGNAGPTSGSALESMGPKPTFRCHFLNIAPIYKQ